MIIFELNGIWEYEHQTSMDSLPSEILGSILPSLSREEARTFRACNRRLYRILSSIPYAPYLYLTAEDWKYKDGYPYLTNIVLGRGDHAALKGLLILHPEWLQNELLIYVRHPKCLVYLLQCDLDPKAPIQLPLDSEGKIWGNLLSGDTLTLYSEEITKKGSTTLIHLWSVVSYGYPLLQILFALCSPLIVDTKDASGMNPLELCSKMGKGYNHFFLSTKALGGEMHPLVMRHLSGSALPAFTLEGFNSNTKEWDRLWKFRQQELLEYYTVRGFLLALMTMLSSGSMVIRPHWYIRVSCTKNIDYTGDICGLSALFYTYDLYKDRNTRQSNWKILCEEVGLKSEVCKGLPCAIPLGVRGLHILCIEEAYPYYLKGVEAFVASMRSTIPQPSQ